MRSGAPMTPEEYVSELCDPGDLVGFQFMQVDRDAGLHGWSVECNEQEKQAWARETGGHITHGYRRPVKA